MAENNETPTLGLKWGRFNFADFKGSPEASKLNDQIHQLDEDDPNVIELTCQMIDAFNGDIYVWWENMNVSKEDAKHYVRNYGKELKN